MRLKAMRLRQFCDLPDAIRLAYRDAVTDAGGIVCGYDRTNMQVALPNPSGAFYEAMQKAGLLLVAGSLHYFPLGSDKPPDNLRHDGNYPGSRGFWCYARFAPPIRTMVIEEHGIDFNEAECGGAFDGTSVISDADPGL
jgi:hypothetical protein